ncbi:MAG TPA: di-heme oxidoredictase family protein [Steroidobacteraceae bacterium]|nr:di-heme oxidoredictase family protein [Steroidobacteraceae bacterium]
MSGARRTVALFVGASLALASVHAGESVASTPAGPEWLTARTGGDTTIAIANENAFARAILTMSPADLRRFTFGNRLFNTNWVAAPASVEVFDGLGPVFNRVSCSACHTRDGRGRPPETEGAPLESMLVRLSLPGSGEHGEPIPVPHYGDQLNEKAIPGVPAEGRVVVRFSEHSGTYPDGSSYSLLVPRYEFADLAYGPLPPETRVSARVAPPVFGLGLLEAVPDAEVLSREDPNDADHDGISGRANRVWNVLEGRVTLGRFGWKANQPSLRQQNAAAANGDIGITTRLFPHENIADGQVAAAAAPSGSRQGEPEMSDEFFATLTFYQQTLAVPAARNVEDPTVRAGADLFGRIGCTACHVPTLTTGDYTDVPELAHQTIHPYSDLLLHDMGKGLADGRPDFGASGEEWRTPPLWGIGLTRIVNRHTRFLHDGRARSLEEAVLWHDGEAHAARERFMRLSRAERAALLTFLENL